MAENFIVQQLFKEAFKQNFEEGLVFNVGKTEIKFSPPDKQKTDKIIMSISAKFDEKTLTVKSILDYFGFKMTLLPKQFRIMDNIALKEINLSLIDQPLLSEFYYPTNLRVSFDYTKPVTIPHLDITINNLGVDFNLYSPLSKSPELYLVMYGNVMFKGAKFDLSIGSDGVFKCILSKNQRIDSNKLKPWLKTKVGFNLPTLPEFYNSEFELTTKDFSFTSNVSGEMKLDFITLKLEYVSISKSKAEFGGSIKIGSAEFSVKFASPGNLSIAGNIPSINLRSLIKAIIGNTPSIIDEIPNLELKNTKIQIEKIESKYNFSFVTTTEYGKMFLNIQPSKKQFVIGFEIPKIPYDYAKPKSFKILNDSIKSLHLKFENNKLIYSSHDTTFNIPNLESYETKFPKTNSTTSLELKKGISLSSKIQVGETFSRNIKDLTGLKLTKLDGDVNFSRDKFDLKASIPEKIKISGDTFIENLSLSIQKTDIVELGIGGDVSFNSKSDPIVFSGMLGVTPTEAVFDTELKEPDRLDDAFGIKNLTITKLGLHLGFGPAGPSFGFLCAVNIGSFNGYLAMLIDPKGRELLAGGVNPFNLNDIFVGLFPKTTPPKPLKQIFEEIGLSSVPFDKTPTNPVKLKKDLDEERVSDVLKKYFTDNNNPLSDDEKEIIIHKADGNWQIFDKKTLKLFQIKNKNGVPTGYLQPQFYICPLGAKFGKTEFKKGFRFDGRLHFLGLHADVHFDADKDGIEFDVDIKKPWVIGGGLLKVMSFTDENKGPSFSLSTKPKNPHLMIQGRIVMLGGIIDAKGHVCFSGGNFQLYVSVTVLGITTTVTIDANFSDFRNPKLAVHVTVDASKLVEAVQKGIEDAAKEVEEFFEHFDTEFHVAAKALDNEIEKGKKELKKEFDEVNKFDKKNIEPYTRALGINATPLIRGGEKAIIQMMSDAQDIVKVADNVIKEMGKIISDIGDAFSSVFTPGDYKKKKRKAKMKKIVAEAKRRHARALHSKLQQRKRLLIQHRRDQNVRLKKRAPLQKRKAEKKKKLDAYSTPEHIAYRNVHKWRKKNRSRKIVTFNEASFPTTLQELNSGKLTIPFKMSVQNGPMKVHRLSVNLRGSKQNIVQLLQNNAMQVVEKTTVKPKPPKRKRPIKRK